MSKLRIDAEKMATILRMRQEGYNQLSVAAAVGVSRASVCRIFGNAGGTLDPVEYAKLAVRRRQGVLQVQKALAGL